LYLIFLRGETVLVSISISLFYVWAPIFAPISINEVHGF